MGTFFRKMRLFFQKAFIINTPPPPPLLCEMLYASHVKLFAETLEFLLHAMFQLTIHKIVSLEHILQGGQAGGSWSVLNWACKEDEEQQTTPLL
jgi:hypothetical protein